MAKVELLVSFLLCICAVHAADHLVGGINGWDYGQNYTEWLDGESFIVGDTLTFKYTKSHDVAEVTKEDYDYCLNGDLPVFDDGNTVIELTSPGTRYFICSISDHCSEGGMWLPVTVKAGSPGDTPNPPPSPTSKTPPSPTSTTPPSPTTASPTTPKTRSPPPPSIGGAAGSLKNLNALLIGVLLISVTLFNFMS